MSLLANALVTQARLRRRVRRLARREPPSILELLPRYAPRGSFADIGCMWNVDGRTAFLAEEHGASAVTGVDIGPATDRFLREHERRGSRVRFVRGDLHDEPVLREIGVHDVVWCAGVLYHAPHPVLTLERLRSITRDVLILGSFTLPEVPGMKQACVFFPALPDAHRRAYARAVLPGAIGLTTPFEPAHGYSNWWWGVTASALEAMLSATGFEVIERHRSPFYLAVAARPVRGE